MVLERAFLEATKTYLHLPDSVWERIFAFLPADALGSVYTCGSRRLQKLLQERQRKAALMASMRELAHERPDEIAELLRLEERPGQPLQAAPEAAETDAAAAKAEVHSQTAESGMNNAVSPRRLGVFASLRVHSKDKHKDKATKTRTLAKPKKKSH